jgi:ribosome-binding factor A
MIKESTSDAIRNHLNDPRIEGLVSVTRVDVAADLRSANVYISILGKNCVAEDKTFIAIEHARGRIQSLLADKLRIKFCPVLHFYKDDKFKKTLETIKLIDQAISEMEKKDRHSNTPEQ